jgi:hypothetical protein
MKQVIRYVALAIVAACWAIIGLFFWIPLLVRAIALYTAVVVISMIRSRDVTGASRDLDRAIVFWIDGFKKVNAGGQPHSGSFRTSYISLRDAGVITVWFLACGLFWFGAWFLLRTLLVAVR